MLVPHYSALLTIREKGIGINAIAGNFEDFIAKGTISLYGGDINGQADGSVNLSANASSHVNMYCGVYLDSAGVMRAAQDFINGGAAQQIQTYWQASATKPPLRWRILYTSVTVVKDAVFNPEFITPWTNITDEELNGANFNSIAYSLSEYFVRNNIVDGIWRKRDCGYFSEQGGTGQLLVPVGTSQTAQEYCQVELSLMWISSNNAEKNMDKFLYRRQL